MILFLLKEDAVPTIFKHIPQVEKRVGVKERVEKRKVRLLKLVPNASFHFLKGGRGNKPWE